MRRLTALDRNSEGNVKRLGKSYGACQGKTWAALLIVACG
jgi:hypothetical protein